MSIVWFHFAVFSVAIGLVAVGRIVAVFFRSHGPYPSVSQRFFRSAVERIQRSDV